MEIETNPPVGRIHFALLTLSLLLMSVGLTVMVWIASFAYITAEGPTRRSLFHLAWMSAATLGLTLLTLLWVVLRWLRLRILPSNPLPQTTYLDAWSEAGKRIRIEGDEFEEEEGKADT